MSAAESMAEEMQPRKPRALKAHSVLMPFAPASPAEFAKVNAGAEELRRLGFQVEDSTPLAPEGYFAGSATGRRSEFLRELERQDVHALVAIRGGYGSNYMLDGLELRNPETAKIVLGYSDLTSLQAFLWKRYGWVSFYGPMLASGFAAGSGAAGGYDKDSLLAALSKTDGGWSIGLQGETLIPGAAEGTIAGGCLTLVETSLGTPWELETDGTILLLEDRGMKPWQVDRSLMHLKQAGKLRGVHGILLGDFPECDAPISGSPNVRDICARILGAQSVPMVFGAPVGHTARAMLTVPLGVRGRLTAQGQGTLEILEPAVVP